MVEAKSSLYRIDFCADLTAVQADVFQIGYMLEAAVADGARFLGLASRRSLTRVELDHVNLRTWPELEDLDGFMDELFEKSWGIIADASKDDLSLGSDDVARNFSAMSALSFTRMDVSDELEAKLQENADEWQQFFYGALCGYGKRLRPTLTADILPFDLPKVDEPSIDMRPKVRSEAA